MKKTSASAPRAFNRQANPVCPYIDIPAMVLNEDLPALKQAALFKVDLSGPHTFKRKAPKPNYQTLLVIYAMEANKREVFDWLLSNRQVKLDVASQYRHGREGMPRLEPGTPLDAAYNLARHERPHGAYFLQQLIANGARLTVGKRAAEIQKLLPQPAKTVRPRRHGIIGDILKRP